MDLVTIATGRQAERSREIVVSPDLADQAGVAPGDQLVLDGRRYDVVGVGETLWWAGTDTAYAGLDTVRALTAERATNRLVLTATDDDDAALRSIVDDVRAVLAPGGDTFTDFPMYLPNGTTPIDADIRQISTLIGMLGIMAGIVALVLLASTTNTLITERTREVAVMRALGGRQRPLRRRLRRIAIGDHGERTRRRAAAGRVDQQPDRPHGAREVRRHHARSRRRLAGARRLAPSACCWVPALVAARAARRVTNQPLAAALRDREGAPFGRTAIQRGLTRLPSGGLFGRIAARASLRRPARTVAVVAQIAAAVGAAFLIPSAGQVGQRLQHQCPARRGSGSRAPSPATRACPFAAGVADADPSPRPAVWVCGSIDDWDIDAYGIAPGSTMFDPISAPDAGSRRAAARRC